MMIVWDERKRLETLQNRGLDFADTYRFDWEDALYAPTYPAEDGRARTMAVGMIDGHLFTIIFSASGSEAISIVSMRPASRKERKRYDTR
jgi:uncharacterized DUF497 family protein